MSTRIWIPMSIVLLMVLLVVVGCSPNPQPVGLTPIPTLAPAEPVSLVPALQTPPPEGGEPTQPEATAQPATPLPTAGEPVQPEATAGPATPLPTASEPVQPEATAEPPTPPPAASRDPAAGEVIYTANCLPCHGPDAAGGAVGPSLVSAAVAAQPDSFFRETITSGRTGTAMPAWGDRLSTQEIEDVIAYIRSKQ